ncbi:MAG TPA: choice-of-anchor tandem repeat GloVer-containing protein [Terriglobia bacterium]|nr:choice-of-anchor tandem repeat GloVer-containing protein [Terriglobia bacterium]
MKHKSAHQQTRRSDRTCLGRLSAGVSGIAGLALVVLAAATVILPMLATKGTAQGNALRYTVFHTFSDADGDRLQGGLIRDGGGNLYGTTVAGGNGGDCINYFGGGCGVVFKLDPSGNETVLYNFSGGADGAYPYAGLVRDAAGNLYGTTLYGGNTSSCVDGCGAVFKVDPAGNETVLHTFTGGGDGGAPYAGLILDGAGNLYGTTYGGGPYGDGTVFKLDPSGNETVLYGFTGGADGGVPYAGLILDPAGNLYGTTSEGGILSYCFPGVFIPGCGVVFKLDPAGKETVLYKFTGGADGASPVAALILDAAGNLYGTAGEGGNKTGLCYSEGCGVVFKLDPAGKETVLHEFIGKDGANPAGGLIRDSAGNLAGTTYNGGSYRSGVLFELDQKDNETVLHQFGQPEDGANPSAGLLQDPAGNLYGTTVNGDDGSVVFKFKLNL